MKFVLFDDGRPGLLRDDGVVDISDVVEKLGAREGQAAMETIITQIDALRADLSHLDWQGSAALKCIAPRATAQTQQNFMHGRQLS